MKVCQLKNNVTVINGGRVIFVVRPSDDQLAQLGSTLSKPLS